MNRCISCGDLFSAGLATDSYPQIPPEKREEFHEVRQLRCWSCAREVVLGTVPRLATTMHSTGGGTRVIKSTRGLS